MVLGNRKLKHLDGLVVLVAIVLIMAIPSVLATPPSIEISDPVDGDWFTDHNITMMGNASIPVQDITLGISELGPGDHIGTQWEGTDLVFRPTRPYHDHFRGTELNMSNWSFIRDLGSVDVNNSILTLTDDLVDGGLYFPTIQSSNESFLPDKDWTAQFKMKFNGGRSGDTPSGGGISPSPVSYWDSAYSTVGFWSYGRIEQHIVLNGTGWSWQDSDDLWHTYTLKHDSTSGVYTSLMDDNVLATFIPDTPPTCFWFGEHETTWSNRLELNVDYATVWMFGGSWESEPVPLDGHSIIDWIEPYWNTSSPSKASMETWVTISDDNNTWSEWVKVVKGEPTRAIEGSWLRFRTEMALPDIMNVRKNITLSGINLRFRHPLELVDVRANGGEWVNATGLEEWSSGMRLEENENLLEARVIDSAGSISNASVQVVLDTTPPTGRFNISNGTRLTNDRNVTLCLNASDRYGVANVLVSYTDMIGDARSYPYIEYMPFEIKTSDGPVELFVWFRDNHGHLSTRVGATVTIDSTPPHAQLEINGNAEYTSTSQVDLDLVYSDFYGVDHIELSTSPHFRDPVSVGSDVTTLSFDLDTSRDGLHHVYMRVVDKAGNEIVVKDSISVFFPRAVGNLTLNDGALSTSSPYIMVRIDTPSDYEMNQMQLSADPSFEGASWEVYSTSAAWQVSSGDGPKTLYARFIDFRGIVSLPINSSIIYDTIAPELAVLMDDGAMYTIHHTVIVELVYRDDTDPRTMWLSDSDSFDDSEPIPFQSPFELTLSQEEGPKTLYVRVEDMAGNAAMSSSTIHLATIGPYIQVEFPKGKYLNDREVVTFTVECDDPYGEVWVQVSLDVDPEIDAEWFPCDRPLEVPIPTSAEEGEHRVHLRARNVPGIWTDVMQVPIVLDWTEPVLEIFEPEDGKGIRQKGHTILLRAKAEDENGILGLSYRLDETEWLAFSDLASMQVDVDTGSYGSHVIEVRAEDRAGNEAIMVTTFHLEKSGALDRVEGGTVFAIIVVSLVAIVVAWFVIMRMRGSDEDS